MDRTYTVYMHVSPSNKVYVGMTKRNPVKRWGHNGYCYKNNDHFSRAIKKYGWDNFQHLILFSNLSQYEAEQKEIELIREYKATNPQFGYNIEHGGNSIGKHSEETKRKISQKHMGMHLSKESKKRISDAHKGNKAWNKGMRMSEEDKIKDALKQKRTPVICIETNQYYFGIAEAERRTGVDKSLIAKVCKGIYKQAGGYHWRYPDS